ncbi:MAG: hypothetical protein JO146_02745 [Candidatus Eremiobacteraeota bacterium]|nr:hypothetical protein [Candidatus Eremiobacteraeota bacterium]
MFRYVVSIGVVVMLTGCAADGSVAPNALVPTGSQFVAATHTDFSSPCNGSRSLRTEYRARGISLSQALAGLFVADDTDDDVCVLQNGTWKDLGFIYEGIGLPNGNWVDDEGNFFQTNTAGADVAEYGRNQTSPKFTYTGFADPVVVTSDTNGDVFVGDDNFGKNGSVTQFRDGHNTPVQSCSLPGGLEGVAVDSNSDVFVAYDTSSSQGQLARFAGGLAGCKASALSVTLGAPGGLVLDRHHNLIVADQTNHVVDVIAPPYSEVGKSFHLNLFQPYRLALNRKENRLFVCEAPHQYVDVLEYPSGKLLIALSQRYGFSGPRGVTDEPNAVF